VVVAPSVWWKKYRADGGTPTTSLRNDYPTSRGATFYDCLVEVQKVLDDAGLLAEDESLFNLLPVGIALVRAGQHLDAATHA